MEALTQVAAARQPVKDAVYQYWLDKRKQLGKPLLRRLQAHTNSSDTNPHSCFRSGPVLLKPFHALLAFYCAITGPPHSSIAPDAAGRAKQYCLWILHGCVYQLIVL